MPFDLNRLVRQNIARLTPYSSARSEFEGDAEIFLDANENAFGSPLGRNYNRYPDPLQTEVKLRVAELNNVRPDQIFIGNGSDEAIDLLIRIFCRPQRDDILICPPTYGMYQVSADINDVAVRRANLTPKFALDADAVLEAVGDNTKLIFLCSPNNPTGNLLDMRAILTVALNFPGIVVVDEAYIHFSNGASCVDQLSRLPNLVVLQTFSKAWGLAGLRVGMAFADAPVIELMNRVKPPYNVSQIAQEAVVAAFENIDDVYLTIDAAIEQRKVLAERLAASAAITKVFPSDANFLLVRTHDAKRLYNFLIDEKIVVRDRSNVALCEGCLRITVGTPGENESLLAAIGKYEKSLVY